MTDNDTTCGAEATFDNGSPNLLCVRDDRHINHRAADGTTFTRMPGGFWIKDPK